MHTENRILLLVVAAVAALVACDPTSPVQSSNVTTDVSQAIATHNADPNAHTNLVVKTSQLNGTIDGTQIADGAVGANNIATGAITNTQISATAGIEGSQLANGAITALQIANATITGANISATAGITGTQLAATAGITGTQLAAGTITTTQINAAAGILGTQLAAAANITGTQLAAAANIAGTQLAAGTISSTQIANSTITDANLNLSVEGMGNSTMATSFFPINTSAAFVSTTITITFTCASVGGAGTVEAFNNNTVIPGTTVTCPTAATLEKITIAGIAAQPYNLRYTAATAAQPVTWQSVTVSF